jgi:hypothetical protein
VKPFAELMKHLPEMSMPTEPVQPGIAWTMRHLRSGYVISAVLAVVGSVVAYFVGGWPAVLGALIGLAVVVLFFSISTWAVVAAGRRDDRLTLPAVMIAFTVKVVLLGVLLVSMPSDGPVDVVAMAWAVLVGALVWAVDQVRFVLRQRMYYIQYHPPKNLDD